ncbi:Uncharacterised protein [Bifidobacterium longum subsp. infantis]|uniref:Uncharacterized protein n=3 Tax=Bifidobacterium longum TaxID=216816 RepID=A0ABP1X7L8_BIFLI|nr:hypothetical protein BLIC_a01839 [Bifidobacterium longum subsp. infantis]CEF02427.1 hypothetical protein BLIC_b01849 [Bifidobacterium longum subsp. infantis]CEF03798.1 hypothetical protein BLIC_c01849 [Bifidobacterium longum subsp. infantis]CEF08580.1 hypothetical protein BLIC_e01862 [Bifidobacterium longum subsp. infantis]CEF11182.1 hypothetical protein BLIC_g01839 [Bifidobacterium longum subsp. infantis]
METPIQEAWFAVRPSDEKTAKSIMNDLRSFDTLIQRK